MIEYVLIDLDGTLLDFDMGEKNAFIDTIKAFSNYCPNDNEYMEFSKINEYYFNEYAKGNMERKTFHYNRFEKIINYLGLNIDIIEANNYYINSLKYQANLFDDVLECLDYLKNKYKLYIVSNGMNDVQIKRMEKANILNYFNNIYISERIGYNKPKIEFFEYVIKDIGDYDKSKYIIIGDRIDSDIDGGNNFGIKTVLLDRKNKFDKNISTYCLDNLIRIKNIL